MRFARIAAVLLVLICTLPGGGDAFGEEASARVSPNARGLDAGADHSCALVVAAGVRCWGFGGDGRLGYGNLETIGDYEAPGSVGPVDLGTGRSATAITAGAAHSCAILDNASVRCWGEGRAGELGYANTQDIGDNEPVASAGPVDLGTGRTALAITSGASHNCAILNLGEVRCWGLGRFGLLGYPANTANIGDDEAPGSIGPVDLGPARTATAISGGSLHTCALVDDSSVRCWGANTSNQLGYPARFPYASVGDDETPGSVPPVDLGVGHGAKAIAAGAAHSCALLDNASVRCWGDGSLGQLGYGNTQNVGDNESPGSAGPVDIGAGRTAKAISAGLYHTCALLDNNTVRCWGWNGEGRLGYGRLDFGGLFIVGDNETPGSVGPVNLGPGRTATAITAGERHTCARLDDGRVRCWGHAGFGQLGNCSTEHVGDDEAPAAAGPVQLTPFPGDVSGCAPRGGGSTSTPRDAPPAHPVDSVAAALKAQSARLQGLRGCLARVGRHARREIRRARRLSGPKRARAKRHIKRHRRQLRSRCRKRYGRTPGRVAGLKARALARARVLLTFKAASTDHNRPPAARNYLVKQSRRPIRTARGFRRAQTLCNGTCRFPRVTKVGGDVELTVRDLRRRTTYYYAVAARDNVSGRLGPRSPSSAVRTR